MRIMFVDFFKMALDTPFEKFIGNIFENYFSNLFHKLMGNLFANYSENISLFEFTSENALRISQDAPLTLLSF